VILVCLAPLLIYRVTTWAAPAWVIGAVVGAQVTGIVWLMAAKLAIQYRAILAALAVAAVSAVALRLELPARSVGLAMAGTCHAAAYAWLLAWFAASLRSDREPVVAGFARRMRRTMPDKVVRYTRQVTVAWCVFFAAQLGISTALLIAAPISVWSSFVTLWNLPLVMVMGLAEFGCRRLLLRREPRTGLIATLVGLRQIGGLPGGGP
jgi:uncharacterized membrane protein